MQTPDLLIYFTESLYLHKDSGLVLLRTHCNTTCNKCLCVHKTETQKAEAH